MYQMIQKCSLLKVLEVFFVEPTTIHFIRRISKEIKFREKIDVHSIEEGYGERWKKRKHTI